MDHQLSERTQPLLPSCQVLLSLCRVDMTTWEEEERRFMPRKLHSYLVLVLFHVTWLSMLALRSASSTVR